MMRTTLSRFAFTRFVVTRAYICFQSKRPAISPHLDFLGELVDFEKRLPLGAVPVHAKLNLERKTSDPVAHALFESSILADNCPWLKTMNITPDSGRTSMLVDSIPATPGHAQQPRQPWGTAFGDSGVYCDAEGHDLRHELCSSSSDGSNHSDELLTPCIVLAPVPKSKGRRGSLPTLGSARSSPPSSMAVDDAPDTFLPLPRQLMTE